MSADAMVHVMAIVFDMVLGFQMAPPRGWRCHGALTVPTALMTLPGSWVPRTVGWRRSSGEHPRVPKPRVPDRMGKASRPAISDLPLACV